MSNIKKPFVKFLLSEGRDICVNISQIQYYIVNVKTKTIKLSLSSGSMDSVTISPKDYNGALQYFESLTVIPKFDKEIMVQKPKEKPAIIAKIITEPKPKIKKPELTTEPLEIVAKRVQKNIEEINKTKDKEKKDANKTKQDSNGLGKNQNTRGKGNPRRMGRRKSKSSRS